MEGFWALLGWESFKGYTSPAFITLGQGWYKDRPHVLRGQPLNHHKQSKSDLRDKSAGCPKGYDCTEVHAEAHARSATAHAEAYGPSCDSARGGPRPEL